MATHAGPGGQPRPPTPRVCHPPPLPAALGHPRRVPVGGAAGAALVGEGLPQPAYGGLAIDLTAALPAEPGHPHHRHRGDDDGWHQPQQDLHASRVGTTGRPTREARQGTYGEPTHSSLPSVNRWCFQIGTSDLRVSIRSRDASKA